MDCPVKVEVPERTLAQSQSPCQTFKGLIHKNLQNVAEGGMAPRPINTTPNRQYPTMVNMVCIITLAVIPP